MQMLSYTPRQFVGFNLIKVEVLHRHSLWMFRKSDSEEVLQIVVLLVFSLDFETI